MPSIVKACSTENKINCQTVRYPMENDAVAHFSRNYFMVSLYYDTTKTYSLMNHAIRVLINKAEHEFGSFASLLSGLATTIGFNKTVIVTFSTTAKKLFVSKN